MKPFRLPSLILTSPLGDAMRLQLSGSCEKSDCLSHLSVHGLGRVRFISRAMNGVRNILTVMPHKEQNSAIILQMVTMVFFRGCLSAGSGWIIPEVQNPKP